MNPWLRRLHILLTIGGGFLGIALTLQALFAAKQLTPITFIMYAGFTGLYVYGIYSGFCLIEDLTYKKHLIVFYCLQIPWISSPIIGYRFTSGFNTTVGIYSSSFSGFFRLGSDWQFNLLQKIPWGIGINVFALVMVIVLINQKKPTLSKDSNVQASDQPILPE